MTDGTDMRGVLTATPAGTSVRFERRYTTDVDDLWTCLTQRDRVARWLGPVHGDLRVGGHFEVRMGDDVPDSPQNATGEVLVCERPHQLDVTWSFPGEPVTRLTVTLAGDDDATVLVLEHHGLDERAARGYGGGWHTCLDRLGDHLAAGDVRSWDELFAQRQALYRDGASG
ncbi:SRPBCC family protein [Cellulomonas fimi]|uniref:Activator of Hsp90 ATPase 1 family protein n=1 Tax=Cellulomonas fimi (strain ATCC 484 / DSM 20113 / JCM 1341 / CCUG 24087 / LMG 16345 / NBRC 15513 / NCIMB 8980 / NCTC 7547 / NRS-133) TaxID=590998 RepID=F4H7S7_CELFA|nr:SRPBCC family protein [Cellulomonas fimi]AEE45761.1 Activator of Hsp90 ATPase 1 family protein [Cellulomonas fimi ATCC 484]NNH08679.1 SRPBCC family protein [Cellulomonas fimi]VEH30521.1 Activator of Hsp90 ATPase homolog 1-like protein [Cellulomonas fimi]